MPPAWMSNVSPRYSMAMTEHSMCQPGRPGPSSVSQNGSPSFGAFQSTKSRASAFSYSSTSTRAPDRMPNDLVIHVGDVHYVIEPHAPQTEPTAENVVKRKRAKISDVGVTIDGGTTRVHPYGVIRGGSKLFHLVSQSVGKTKRHKWGS